MIRFLLRALAAALGFWVASKIIPGVHVANLTTLIEAGLLLGLVNALVRPILIFLTLPLTLITLGLFLLVVNGLMVSLVAFFLHGVHVHGFIDAILASIVISLTSWAASGLIDSVDSRRRR